MKNNYCGYVEKGVRLKLYDFSDGIYAYIKPCCHITHEMIPLEISKPVKINSAKDIMNLMPMQYYRDYFANNDNLHPACIGCTNYEQKGINSPRNKINNNNFDGYDINKLDVVLGNSCNLACPFCTSYASSLIDKLSNKLDKENRPESWIPLKNIYSSGSNKTAAVIAEILQTHRVHTLKLIGGEPFLKENWDKIAEVIDQEYCSELHLEITTNGTIINDEIMDRLNKTKSAHLRISVDSIGSNYEFIRWPHTWKKMDKNLTYLKNNKQNNVHISVSNLVNIFNFEFLPEIEAYFKDVKDLVGYSVEIKPITHLMNYQNLPDNIINSVKDKIQSSNLKKSLTISTNKRDYNEIKREFEILLNQRNMKTDNVIGPLTREWLNL